MLSLGPGMLYNPFVDDTTLVAKIGATIEPKIVRENMFDSCIAFLVLFLVLSIKVFHKYVRESFTTQSLALITYEIKKNLWT